MSKTIFARSSGDPEKKSPQAILEEKRKVNHRCMELRLSHKSAKAALQAAQREGITNRNGKKMTEATLMYRCQWALIDAPDYWRDRIDAYDRKPNDPPMTDDEWDKHVVEVGIELAHHSAGIVFKLFLSDPARWGRWSSLWEGNSDFSTLNMPTLVGQRTVREKVVV